MMCTTVRSAEVQACNGLARTFRTAQNLVLLQARLDHSMLGLHFPPYLVRINNRVKFLYSVCTTTTTDPCPIVQHDDAS
jgi:hypothetical protein